MQVMRGGHSHITLRFGVERTMHAATSWNVLLLPAIATGHRRSYPAPVFVLHEYDLSRQHAFSLH